MATRIKIASSVTASSDLSKAKSIGAMLEIIDKKGDTSILHPMEMQVLDFWKMRDKTTYKAEGTFMDLEELGRIMYACCL